MLVSVALHDLAAFSTMVALRLGVSPMYVIDIPPQHPLTIFAQVLELLSSMITVERYLRVTSTRPDPNQRLGIMEQGVGFVPTLSELLGSCLYVGLPSQFGPGGCLRRSDFLYAEPLSN